MPEDKTIDYYEVLQVSPSAEPETIHRVYRMLAQRVHPDNIETGDERRFHQLAEIYAVLSDPEKRAKYDVAYHHRRQDRLRLVSTSGQAENDFEAEQITRLTVLEALYTKRRIDPENPSFHWLELEELIGRPREHLEFTLWFLKQKKLITSDDSSNLILTVEGAEYLEQNYRISQPQKRLQPSKENG
jgi:curved DNA-binding protein CbpA